MRYLLFLRKSIHGKYREFGSGIVQRIDQRPIGNRHQRTIAGKIISGNAIFFPEFHGHHGRNQFAVAKEEHIIVFRLFQKTAQQISAFFSHQHIGNHHKHRSKQRNKDKRFRHSQPEPFSHDTLTLCIDHLPAFLQTNGFVVIFYIISIHEYPVKDTCCFHPIATAVQPYAKRRSLLASPP